MKEYRDESWGAARPPGRRPSLGAGLCGACVGADRGGGAGHAGGRRRSSRTTAADRRRHRRHRGPGGRGSPVRLAGARQGDGPVAAAAAVSARMAAAMSSFRTLQGTMTTSGSEGYANGATFATDAAGDFSLRFPAGPPSGGAAGRLSTPLILTYDARRHVAIDTYLEPDGSHVSYEWRQSPPYEGVGVPGWTYPYPPGYAWLVRAALADGDPRITVGDTVFDGRSAWTVSLPSQGTSAIWRDELRGRQAERVPRALDLAARSGRPALERFQLAHGAPRRPCVLARDVLDQRPSRRQASPSGEGRLLLHTRAVRARVGFRPFVPSRLPRGYRLSDVATDSRSAADVLGWNGPDPGSHDPHTEAFLRYRRGADAFTVHVYSIAGIRRDEVAGYYVGLKGMPAYGSALLRTGAFAGRRAQTWFALSGANLLVVGRTYVAYISGSLTRRQLYDVASSLRQS